jgi:hypothetical protein
MSVTLSDRTFQLAVIFSTVVTSHSFTIARDTHYFLTPFNTLSYITTL